MEVQKEITPQWNHYLDIASSELPGTNAQIGTANQALKNPLKVWIKNQYEWVKVWVPEPAPGHWEWKEYYLPSMVSVKVLVGNGSVDNPNPETVGGGFEKDGGKAWESVGVNYTCGSKTEPQIIEARYTYGEPYNRITGAPAWEAPEEKVYFAVGVPEVRLVKWDGNTSTFVPLDVITPAKILPRDTNKEFYIEQKTVYKGPTSTVHINIKNGCRENPSPIVGVPLEKDITLYFVETTDRYSLYRSLPATASFDENITDIALPDREIIMGDIYGYLHVAGSGTDGKLEGWLGPEAGLYVKDNNKWKLLNETGNETIMQSLLDKFVAQIKAPLKLPDTKYDFYFDPGNDFAYSIEYSNCFSTTHVGIDIGGWLTNTQTSKCEVVFNGNILEITPDTYVIQPELGNTDFYPLVDGLGYVGWSRIEQQVMITDVIAGKEYGLKIRIRYGHTLLKYGVQVFDTPQAYAQWQQATKYDGAFIQVDDKYWAFPWTKTPVNTVIGSLHKAPPFGYDVTPQGKTRLGLQEKGAHIHLQLHGVWMEPTNLERQKQLYNETVIEKIKTNKR